MTCAMWTTALALHLLFLLVTLTPASALRLPRDTSLHSVHQNEKSAAEGAVVEAGATAGAAGTAEAEAAAQGTGAAVDKDRRATWLSTRQMEDDFKELVFLAIQELSNEGRLDPGMVKERSKTKRGRWQGFCFQRTSSGRFLPYICWKGDRK